MDGVDPGARRTKSRMKDIRVPPAKMTFLQYHRDKRAFVAVADLKLWLAECELANDDPGAKALARLLRAQFA